MVSSIKIIIFQTHPIQYWVPLYRELSKIDNISLKIVYATMNGLQEYYDEGFGLNFSWDVDLVGGYEHILLSHEVGKYPYGFRLADLRKINDLLNKENPDWVFVDGYKYAMNWFAILWSLRYRKKVGYTSDSNINNKRTLLALIAKEIPVRVFFSMVSLFFAPSNSNKRYLKRYGVGSRRIVSYPYPVDFDKFNRYSVEKKTVDFIWAGKFTERKRPLDFIKALYLLRQKTNVRFKARMIGDGILKKEVCETGNKLIADGFLEIRGFVNYSMMPKELSSGKVFVFTSEDEPYGIVATEAAAVGSALIVAEDIGCVGIESSAQPNINSIVYTCRDVQLLADKMEELLIDQTRLRYMQENSKRIGYLHRAVVSARIIATAII